MEAERVSFPTARLRPSASLRVATALVALLAATLGGAMLVTELWTMLISFSVLLLLPLTGGMAWLYRRSHPGGVGLTASAEGLRLTGRLVLARDELQRALVVTEKGGTTVALQRRGRLVSVVDVASEQEGRELVQALGLDAAHSTSEFAFDAPPAQALSRAGFFAYTLLPLLLIPLVAVGLVWLIPPLMLLWYGVLLAMAFPRRLIVGLDGVLLRWAHQQRLIPYELLRDVQSDDEEVRLVLRSGEVIRLSALHTGQPWETGRWKNNTGFGSRKGYIDAVARRLREAREASQGGAGAVAALLLRGNREPLAWLRGLRSLLDPGREHFREGSLHPELLWATLEDARGDPTARVAAATALAPGLDQAGQQRLRVAASAVVNPRLRVALEATLAHDDQALADAIQTLEDERRPQAPGRLNAS